MSTDDRPLCVGKHVLFDSIELRDHQLARQFCANCPVITACEQRLAEVTTTARNSGHPEGTWAGRLLVDPKPRHVVTAETRRAKERREFEDRVFTESDARKAHAAFVGGDKSDWARMGHRVYDRRRKHKRQDVA